MAHDGFYLSIYGIYIAPLQGNYSEALPAQARGKMEGLEETIKRARKITWKRAQFERKAIPDRGTSRREGPILYRGRVRTWYTDLIILVMVGWLVCSCLMEVFGFLVCTCLIAKGEAQDEEAVSSQRRSEALLMLCDMSPGHVLTIRSLCVSSKLRPLASSYIFGVSSELQE